MSNSTDYLRVLWIDILTNYKSSPAGVILFLSGDAVGGDYSFSLFPINLFFRVFKCFLSLCGGFITFSSCLLDKLPFFKLFYRLFLITFVKFSLFSFESPPIRLGSWNNLL